MNITKNIFKDMRGHILVAYKKATVRGVFDIDL